MAKKVGNLFVSLSMNSASFKRSAEKATKIFKKFERKLIKSTRKMRRSVNKVGKSMAKMAGAAVLAAGTVGIAALTVASFKSADQLAKTSDKLGITTEKLAGLRLAGEVTGVGVRTMDMALQRMVRRLSEASNGTGEAVKAIKELNLDAKELSRISPEKAFAKIAEAMKGTATQSDKVRLAMKFFDSEGVALVNTLALGKEGLNKMSTEADELGLSISRISAAKIESANDSITKAKSVLTGLGNTIATKLAPFIDAIATSFFNAAKESNGFKNEVTNSVDSIVNGIGFIADAARGLQVVWKGVGTAFAGIANIFMQGLDAIANAQVSFIRLFDEDFKKPEIFRIISSAASDAQERLDKLSEEFDLLVGKELPSDNIKKWAEEVQAVSQAAAEKVAETKSKMVGGTGTENTLDREALEKTRINSMAKLDILESSLLSENERLQESFLNRSFMVEDAFQNELIGIGKRNSLIEALETEHSKKLNKINKDASDKRTKVLAGQLGAAASIFSSISGLMSKEGKKQSALQKTLARASIIASTAQAVMNALAVPPYPLGVSLAVAAGLKGAEQLSKVGGGGGGGGTSIGGLSQTSTGVDQGAPPSVGQAQQQSNNITQLIFNGDMLGEDLSERLIEIIKTATNDRDIVLFDSDSRQAQEILEAG